MDLQHIRPAQKCVIGQCNLANKNTWLIETCDWSMQIIKIKAHAVPEHVIGQCDRYVNYQNKIAHEQCLKSTDM